jgi:hypothetical protein
MHLSDVFIHINEKTNESEQDELVKQLRNLGGVIASRFNEEKDHLLLVSYNSDTINSAALLEKVRENGFNAQLVGL